MVRVGLLVRLQAKPGKEAEGGKKNSYTHTHIHIWSKSTYTRKAKFDLVYVAGDGNRNGRCCNPLRRILISDIRRSYVAVKSIPNRMLVYCF